MLGLVIYTLTILAIGTQKSLEEHLWGNTGCLVYTIIHLLLNGWTIVGGTGMALFRLICLKSITMSDWKKSYILQRILIGQFILLLITVAPVLGRLSTNNTWEGIAAYRFCKDMDKVHADVLMFHRQNFSLDSTAYDVLLVKITYIFITLGLAVFEFAVYAKIIHDLWLHDKESLRGGIITQNMRQERNRKNVLTLKGQIACFIVHTSRISVMAIGPIFNLADVTSLTVIVPIIGNSFVAFTQLWASHEVKRFVKEKIE